MRKYPLRKSQQSLRQVYHLFQKRKDSLDSEIAQEIKTTLIDLQEAVLNHDREKASTLAKAAELSAKNHLRKGFSFKFKESFVALSIALCLAVLIRQTWFENYEIPSGSMRPTLMEKDKLVVSKAQFGINVPLRAAHALFEPENVKRMGIVSFTGEGLDIPNVHTRYFFIFPGIKQYVKRLVGLPNDTLYFYGGRIYGIDAEGNDISDQLQKEELSYLEHIPFIHLEGKVDVPRHPVNELYSPIIHSQSGIPLAKLQLGAKEEVNHKILHNTSDTTSIDFHEFWGMNNFANARIVTRQELMRYRSQPQNNLPYAEYFLELSHHPSATKSAIQKDQYFRNRPKVDIEHSFIPLTEAHMKAIWNSLYTSRIVFNKGYFHRWGMTHKDVESNGFLPKIKGGIPDGTYEFLNGEIYQVSASGLTQKLSDDHPLATYSAEKCYWFYNLGIECDKRFIIRSVLGLTAARYAYFRDGDLYLMGKSILHKDDPMLKDFVKRETRISEIASNYIPFVDNGPPLKADGSLDVEKILTYGLHVPEKHYYVLGDNHAVSYDSREFGFVPEDNIRGVPSFIFWASNGRYGFPNNGLYPTLTTPRIIIWTVFGIFFAIWGYSNYRKNKLPLSF